PDPAHPERRGTAPQERPLLECNADPREPDRTRLPPVRQGAPPQRPALASSRGRAVPGERTALRDLHEALQTVPDRRGRLPRAAGFPRAPDPYPRRAQAPRLPLEIRRQLMGQGIND